MLSHSAVLVSAIACISKKKNPWSPHWNPKIGIHSVRGLSGKSRIQGELLYSWGQEEVISANSRRPSPLALLVLNSSVWSLSTHHAPLLPSLLSQLLPVPIDGCPVWFFLLPATAGTLFRKSIELSFPLVWVVEETGVGSTSFQRSLKQNHVPFHTLGWTTTPKEGQWPREAMWQNKTLLNITRMLWEPSQPSHYLPGQRKWSPLSLPHRRLIWTLQCVFLIWVNKCFSSGKDVRISEILKGPIPHTGRKIL